MLLHTVTGVNIYLIAGIVCAICVFYTFVGGIKAVVSTDAWVMNNYIFKQLK